MFGQDTGAKRGDVIGFVEALVEVKHRISAIGEAPAMVK
jgi:hypothetical protein